MDTSPREGGAAAAPGAPGAGEAGDPAERGPRAPRFLGSLRFRLMLLVLLAVGPAAGMALHEGIVRRREARDPAAEADLLRSTAALSCVALAAVLASWLFGNYFILERLSGLAAAARRLSRGEIRARRRPRDRYGGELGQLERAFDEMALSLETRTEELRRAEARYREIVELNPAVFYVATPGAGGRVEYMSPRIGALTGHAAAEWVGRPGLWDEVVDPADAERVRREIRGAVDAGVPYETEYRIRARGGAVVWVRDTGTALGAGDGGALRVRGFLVNITDRKVLERQFLQAQKMEALGRLAASVAHDFNNLLTVISGYSQLLQSRLGGDPPAREQLEEIHRAADRASVLTRQLLHFSRRQGADPVVLDLNEAVLSLDRMTRRLVGDRVQVETSLAAGVHPVLVDRGHVDQVLMNLVVNARDAMPEGGRITIRTGNVRLDPDYVRRQVEARPGDYACLTLSDTGCGMDDETRGHIFEPFFTTKSEGKGTGLGLSTVYGIVRQAGGHIEVYSAPGRGTTFKIYLPRHDGAGAGGAGAAGGGGAARGAGRRILVVDDEPSLRGFAREILELEGHAVLEASTAGEALRILEREGGGIDLLLADASLPDGDGGRLAGEAVASRPPLRAVVMSGFSRSALGEEGREGTGLPFLQKPFRAEELREALARALGGGGPGRGSGAEAGT